MQQLTYRSFLDTTFVLVKALGTKLPPRPSLLSVFYQERLTFFKCLCNFEEGSFDGFIVSRFINAWLVLGVHRD